MRWYIRNGMVENEHISISSDPWLEGIYPGDQLLIRDVGVYEIIGKGEKDLELKRIDEDHIQAELEYLRLENDLLYKDIDTRKKSIDKWRHLYYDETMELEIKNRKLRKRNKELRQKNDFLESENPELWNKIKRLHQTIALWLERC